MQPRTQKRLSALIVSVALVAGITSTVSAQHGGGGHGGGGGGGDGGGGGHGGGGGDGGSGSGSIYSDLLLIMRDVDGVPLLQTFAVDTEEGPVTERCVQPFSPTPVPGLPAAYEVANPDTGALVYRLPLVGETAMPLSSEIVPFDVDVEDVCSVQLDYTSYLQEADLERLNMSRRPSDTRDARLATVTDKLNAGTDITLDGAGRLTIDGVTLDAGPDHAAIYWSLMTTGTIPGLGAAPAMVQGFDPWMLAAASLGTAGGKEIPLVVDTVQYYNRIIGLIEDHVPTAQWSLDFLETSPSTGEQFVDFSEFS